MATNPQHNPEAAIRALAKNWPADVRERPLWRIIDWPLHFENNHTRKLTRLPFVLLPTKHDGKGFRRVARHTGNTAIFTAWVLMAQLAAKTPARGYLADEDGPYSTLDMADMTGFSPEIFDLALTVLSATDIRWLEKIPVVFSRLTPDNLPSSPECLPASPENPEEINHLQNLPPSPDNLPPSPDHTGERGSKRREEKIREEKERIPLSSPEGDNEPDSSESEAAEKKESRGPKERARTAADAGARILAMFPGAAQLSQVSIGQLYEHVDNGTLPADEKKWRALEAMRAERAAIEGKPDDRDLCYAWLVSKERLCRDLAEALEIAAATRPQTPRPAHSSPVAAISEPEQWQDRLRALYPHAFIPETYAQVMADVRREIEATPIPKDHIREMEEAK
jgi:hypothetical protein